METMINTVDEIVAGGSPRLTLACARIRTFASATAGATAVRQPIAYRSERRGEKCVTTAPLPSTDQKPSQKSVHTQGVVLGWGLDLGMSDTNATFHTRSGPPSRTSV